MLDSRNESYIGLIKHLSSTGKINIYTGHGVEMDNADVGVEDSDGGVEEVAFKVNDSGFNVEDVEVDFDDGSTVTHGPTSVVGVDSSVAGPSAIVEETSVARLSDVTGSTSVAAEETGGVGLFGVAGSTRVETDNVEAGDEDINEGRENDDDDDDDEGETDDNSDSSYSADTVAESEDLRGEVWVTDDEDEELTQIFEKARRFKEKTSVGTVGDEDLIQDHNCDGPTDQRQEDNKEDTDYLASDDVGNYQTDSDGEVVYKKSKNFFNESSEPRFELVMIFQSNIQFKEAIKSFVVANRFDYKYTKNEKDRIREKCKVVGCPFMIYLGKGADGVYQIKTLVSKHTCFVTFKNRRADYKFVGKHFLSKLRIMPKLRLKDMMALGKEEIKVELTKNVCCRVRK
ncbi:hypothetical protein V6N13_094045 [Hibiscus sabdariffa]|uniref:Transposase MuDR plant domain-containing protein n=1 Tax=Hibiscus sabdariffa TaxID=183260 RepID=A0ABR2BIG4_9ROSI